MATLTGYTLPIDMAYPYGNVGEYGEPSSTAAPFYDSEIGDTIVVTGSGFTFNLDTGEPTGGTATGFYFLDGYFGGSTIATVTGLSMPLTTLWSYHISDNWLGFVQLAASGNDLIVGGSAGDQLYGYAGNDSVVGGGGADALKGNAGADTLRGGAGTDDLRGGQDGDQLYGGSDNDFLAGALGNDLVRGALGHDTVGGGQGNDTVGGGQGDDDLRGGQGNDQLNGGLGFDYFIFANHGAANADTVADFEIDIDLIVLDPAVFIDIAHIFYDDVTGELFFSPTGELEDANFLFATVTGAPDLIATDFLFAA